jgi:hypothetical protein
MSAEFQSHIGKKGYKAPEHSEREKISTLLEK